MEVKKVRKATIILLVIAVAACLLAGCGGSENEQKDNIILVYFEEETSTSSHDARTYRNCVYKFTADKNYGEITAEYTLTSQPAEYIAIDSIQYPYVKGVSSDYIIVVKEVYQGDEVKLLFGYGSHFVSTMPVVDSYDGVHSIRITSVDDPAICYEQIFEE